ncbi:MAG TPA: iron-sulfur cluster assembly accessory protein [Gammaproteobacteria bacterium]|nr:iron-sulfur cluster assembly accessory protein [Gammaproteobacteria bacterium]
MTTQCELSMTDSAYDYLKGLMKKQESCAVMRISMKSTGCSGWEYLTAFEKQPLEGDVRVECRGIQMSLPKDQVIYFQGTCLDLRLEALGQSKIIFLNPNAVDHCGCGDSFALKKDVKSNES